MWACLGTDFETYLAMTYLSVELLEKKHSNRFLGKIRLDRADLPSKLGMSRFFFLKIRKKYIITPDPASTAHGRTSCVHVAKMVKILNLMPYSITLFIVYETI